MRAGAWRAGVELAHVEASGRRIRAKQVREGISSVETEADQAFKALANAMATLSDEQKRRA